MDAHDVIQRLAARHGVSAEQVQRDIQAAIDAAWDNPPDSKAAALQRQIPCAGARPTPEELLAHMGKKAMQS